MEVDLRSERSFPLLLCLLSSTYLSTKADSEQIKALLTRLTQHSTFPNIFIAGKSVGGYDDLKQLDTKGELVTLLANAGVSSNTED